MPGINWDVVIKILTALITLLTAIIGYFKGKEAPHDLIKKEAEIIHLLPESSAGRKKLEELLVKHVEALEVKDGYKRNLPAFIISFILTPLMTVFTVRLISLGGWWQLLAAVTGFCASAFLYGIFDSIQLAPRNENGTRKK